MDNLPSPSEVLYFLEVARTQNLTRASERLGITQPSLSLAIQRLETKLGRPLLVRQKTGVHLTKSGDILLSESQKLLAFWNQVKEKTLASATEVQGHFVLGCHPSVALYCLPKFLPKMLTQHPNLHVSLRHDLSRRITDGIISAEIDFGVVVNPVRHPDLVVKKYYSDEVGLWESKKYLKKKNRANQIVYYDPDLVQVQTIMKGLKPSKDFKFRPVTTNSLELIAALVVAGEGFGILPGKVAEAHLALMSKVEHSPVFKDEICGIYRTENRDCQVIRTFSKLVSEALRVNS